MNEKGKSIDIPVQGNLGILAHGDIAIEAWRKVRGPIKYPEVKEKENKNDKK